MVNFMWQCDWPQGAQVKHYFWVYLWGHFRMRPAFASVDSVVWTALPSMGGHHPIQWGPEQNKRWKKEEFSPFLLPAYLRELGHCTSALGPRYTPPAPLFSGRQTQIELHHQFSQVSSLQTVDRGFPSLHNHISPVSCFFGEHWLKHR